MGGSGHMKQIHWSVYVAIATLGTTSIGLLLVAGVKAHITHGQWGLFLALVASVISCGVICDRFARRMLQAMEDQARQHAERNEEIMRCLANEVLVGCNDQTRKIAEEASQVILRLVNEEEEATPIRPRRR